MGPPRLFVYGTLQPGRLRWRFLAPFAVEQAPAAVPGRLYDTGYGWPVAWFGGTPEIVPGTLVTLHADRVDEALELLDDVEATATDVLRRVVVTTTDGVEAWAYECRRPEEGWTPITRWLTRDER